MRYVYPVISRRAGGVSVGINLNPNNACNWHCTYCQVPGLKRGVAPEIDLELLRRELSTLLDEILNGDFMLQRVAEGSRQLCDIAISGNGEPTSCRAFDAVVEVILAVMSEFSLSVPLRLISNGSYLHKADVQRGLRLMAACNGEVWVKVDAVSSEAILRINGIKLDAARLRKQVEAVALLCPTWIQTCLMAWDEQPPAEAEMQRYIEFLAQLQRDGVPLCGVLLYGLARPSLQAEAKHLKPLDAGWMEMVAARIEASGLKVKLSL
nr:radical SAM protein [Mariprofundus sp. KV]